MINYQLIENSIKFYESYGFKRVESPWTVTEAVSNITKPSHAKEFKIEGKGKVLVASAEQSFLYLYLKGFLPKGQFQSVTPCFRDEVFDNWHTKYFIKNELIKTDKVNEEELDIIVQKAFDFFGTIFGKSNGDLQVIFNGKDMYDIVYKDTELGSYGIRECNFLKWIYGTGCAEPRTSMVLKLENKNGLS